MVVGVYMGVYRVMWFYIWWMYRGVWVYIWGVYRLMWVYIDRGFI